MEGKKEGKDEGEKRWKVKGRGMEKKKGKGKVKGRGEGKGKGGRVKGLSLAHVYNTYVHGSSQVSSLDILENNIK